MGCSPIHRFPRERLVFTFRIRSECGTSLLELLLTLPLLLLLIAGLVDLWQLVRQGDLALTASRHAARSAGALAHQIEANGDLQHACNDSGGTSAVLNVGVSLAFRYLVGLGLEKGTCVPQGTPVRSCTGTSFIVRSEFQTVCEGAFAQREIRVTVESTATPHCLICFQRMFEALRPISSSLFPVEADCAKLGTVVCS